MGSIWNVEKWVILEQISIRLKTFYCKSVWLSAPASRDVATLAFLQQLQPRPLLLRGANSGVGSGTASGTRTNHTTFLFPRQLSSFPAASVKEVNGSAGAGDSSRRNAAGFLTIASKYWLEASVL